MLKSLFFQTIILGLLFVLALFSVNVYLYTTFISYVLIIGVHLYYAGNPEELLKNIKKDNTWLVIYPFVHFGFMLYFDVTFNTLMANVVLGVIYYSLIIYNRHQYFKLLKERLLKLEKLGL
jgi:hypothetical protein